MRNWHLIAIFMMSLIVSMPVVFAQELSIQQLNGKGSTKGYARAHDELTIEVLAKIPGEDIIDAEQVRLYVEDSYTTFDKCAKFENGTYFKCTFVEPDFEAYEPITFTIELRDDDGNIVGSETKQLIVDNNAPVIKEFNVEPNVTSGPVSISYIAEDYGLQYGTPEQCSGIKTITITAGNQSITDAGAEGACTKDNNLQLTLAQTGNRQICATAKDHTNFASAPSCKQVTVDKAPPAIESVSIYDKNGFVLTHVHSGEERTADVTAVIKDDGGIDSSLVYANFGQLNPNLPDFVPADITSGDLYTWVDIPVSEVSPCELTISATDLLGNKAEEKFPCDIKADDTPPVSHGIVITETSTTGPAQPQVTEVQITGAITGLVIDETPPSVTQITPTRDGIPLLGYGAPLIIEFEDKDNTGAPGIGFMSGKAYLDLHEIGLGANAQADTCSKLSGGVWRCVWYLNPPSTVAEGTYTITLLSDTSDDLDNKMGVPTEYEIIYDNQGPYQPQVLDFKILTGEEGVEYQGGAVKGSFVQYTVRSANFDTAYANFSDIGGSDATEPTECNDVANTTRDCIFESLVDISGPYTAQFVFVFADDANNIAQTTTTLEIYGIDNETSPKYWKQTPTVTCSPRLIDRQAATLIPPYVACRIDLSTPRKDITTLTVVGPESADECTGDVELTVNDLYIVNNAEGSTSPYMFIVLEPKNYYVNDITINCPIEVFSKRAVTVGNITRYYVTSEPQELPVNITLQLYNNPLEDAAKSVDKKIKKAMKSGLAGQKWIGELNKWIHYGEMMCYAKTLITNIIGLLYLIAILLGIIGEAQEKVTGTREPSESAKVNLCNYEEQLEEEYGGTIIEFLDAICSVINCNAVTGKGAGIVAYAGGGVPWCKDVGSFFSGLTGGGTDSVGGGMEKAGISTPTVKDSLVMSLICLCLPGIIRGLQKMREVDCFKAVCLNDYVKEQGYPTSFCDEMHGFLMCQFVVGEIFALIPIASFFDSIMEMVLSIVTDPVRFFTTAIGAVCEWTCTIQGSLAMGLCAAYKTLAVIAEAVAAVITYTKNKEAFGTPVSSIYCDRMEDIDV